MQHGATYKKVCEMLATHFQMLSPNQSKSQIQKRIANHLGLSVRQVKGYLDEAYLGNSKVGTKISKY
jgi:hypothetical protein